MCADHNVLTLILIGIFSELKKFPRKYFDCLELNFGLAVNNERLQLTGVGFITTPHATPKLSIVNTVQKISQIFSYSVAEIV